MIDHDTGTVRLGEFAHFCYDWDLMLIDETDREFEACLCFRPHPHAP